MRRVGFSTLFYFRLMAVIVILLLLSMPFVIGMMISAPKYRGPVSDHFDGKKFFTPGGAKPHGLKEVLKWMLNRNKKEWKELPAAPGKRPLDFFKDGIRITFVNHTTFLIQVDGVNILTDPVWSKRASPFRWSGPKRMRPPGLRMEDLPRIDYVLLSHNHYDHLDMQTLSVIAGAHHPEIITPLGVKAFLDKEQIAKGKDIDWWDKLELKNGVEVTSVPAQHFSGRGTLDRDATLWCGFVLSTSRGKIYFAGDTGYHETLFKEIGEKMGGIRLSILPIGAYKPAWFMSPVHTSPEEAVKIHLDIKSQLSIGSHFGTFALADEGFEDPVNDLRIAKNKLQIPDTAFITLEEGQPFVIE
jgi:L-ascorbate metabolism protein UlaG (beta-lactamase superfamily)